MSAISLKRRVNFKLFLKRCTMHFFRWFIFLFCRDPRNLMSPQAVRAIELGNKYSFVFDCILCETNFPSFKPSTKQNFDVLFCRLLAIMDGAPHKDFTNLLPVTREETRMFERAAINFLRRNDRFYPTMEIVKIQFLLRQIWYLLMR